MAVSDAGTIELGGRTVNRLGFGAMRITGDGIWGPPKDHDEALAVLRRAVELGVTLIDTADSYGPYVSEDLIHEALHWQVGGENYGDVVVATKGGLTRHGPNVWPPLGRREYLRQCILMSLRRLDIDQIPLWQLHRIDPKTPREEQFAEVKSFLDDGLALQVGLSEVERRRDQGGAGRRAAGRVGAEPLQPGGPGGRGRPRLLRGERHRVHPVGADRVGLARPSRRGAGQGLEGAPGDHDLAARAGLAAAPLAGDGADPGHGLGGPPRGEPRGGRRRS